MLATPSDSPSRHALILTVGYGEGHRAAARAFGEHWQQRGHSCAIHDALEESSVSRIYRATCSYYRFCVHHAPFLWELTYNHTESTDLSEAVRGVLFAPILRALRSLIEHQQPDLLVCTYPLYGYLLDRLYETGVREIPYLMLVTDSIAMSRPWLRSKASMWSVLDEHSHAIALDRYAIPASRLCVAALPIAARFSPGEQNAFPAEEARVLYAAYAPHHQLRSEIDALLTQMPHLRLTILGGAKYQYLVDLLACYPAELTRGVRLLQYSSQMDELFRSHELYIGKAGAATVYEAYQTGIPLIINFALPGQEQGNLELIQRDRVGIHAQGGQALCDALYRLLRNKKQLLHIMRQRMLQSTRRDGASRLIDFVLDYLSKESC